MKKVVIEAFNGIGKEKKLAGKREVDMPETPEEAVKLFGVEDTMDYIRASFTIEIQRQIRAGTTMSAKAQLAAIQAYARANPDSDVAKTLAALKISTEGKSETESETDSPKSEAEKA
jgi:hypothetical protein